jgi:hypothetical protein
MTSVLRRDFLMLAAGSIGRDRAYWRRSRPDFAIFLPSGHDDGTNQQVVAAATPKKTLIVTWTSGSAESRADHRQVVSRSTDGGRTWSHPLVLDQQGYSKDGVGDGHRAQYGFPVVVPSTGRVYVFYSKNTGQNQTREDTNAILTFAYSDDDGETWGKGPKIELERCEWSHPDPAADPNWVSIYAPLRSSRGTVIAGVGRYKAGPGLTGGYRGMERETELCFYRFDNVLTERDPARLTVSTFPKGGRGLRLPRKDNPKYMWSNEPGLIELADGRIFAAFRTRNDCVYWTQSADQGVNWSPTAPLLYRNGGEPMLNPNAPCPIVKLSDGRIVILFYNQPVRQAVKKEFGARDPVWISVGHETPGKPQPVEFGRPRKFMDIAGEMVPGGTAWPQIASYSSFLEYNGKLHLFYNDCKYFVLGKAVPDEFLEPRW